MKDNILNYILILFSFIIISSNCNRPTDEEELPVIITLDVTDISTTTAFSGINIIGDTSNIGFFGICWDTISKPTFSDNCITWLHILKTSYRFMMRDLMHSSWYFVRAYAIVGTDTIYGDEKSFKTADTFIGDNFQGGKVAYIFRPGDPGYVQGEVHGLVISPENLVTHDRYSPYPITQQISWDDEASFVTTGATGQVIGTGNSNTITIVSALGLGSYANIPRFYAARLCYDLVINGYSDWYLPSIVELDSILVNHKKLGLSSTYWSSTEINSGTALILTFYEQGTIYEIAKGYQTHVRAVRTF
jgi:hypothetical protein